MYLVIAGYAFDIGNLSFFDLQKLQSIVEHQSPSRRRKFLRTAWYLHNFDRPLGLPGHRWQCFFISACAVRAISSEDDCTSLTTAVAINHEASVAPVSILPFCRMPTIMHVYFFIHLAWCSFTFAFYIIPSPAAQIWTATKKQVDTRNPR